jgi:glycosyltransferase involved in cell wall biosynthesis
LQDVVVDAGWVALEELPGVLAAADAGVYLMEDTLINRAKCPVKLADMLYAGVPVVAEAVGQVAEYVIHNRTGLLRDSGDDQGIADDLIQLVRDKTLSGRLARNAAAHIRDHFNWESLSRRVEAAYSGDSLA